MLINIFDTQAMSFILTNFFDVGNSHFHNFQHNRAFVHADRIKFISIAAIKQ